MSQLSRNTSVEGGLAGSNPAGVASQSTGFSSDYPSGVVVTPPRSTTEVTSEPSYPTEQALPACMPWGPAFGVPPRGVNPGSGGSVGEGTEGSNPCLSSPATAENHLGPAPAPHLTPPQSTRSVPTPTEQGVPLSVPTSFQCSHRAPGAGSCFPCFRDGEQATEEARPYMRTDWQPTAERPDGGGHSVSPGVLDLLDRIALAGTPDKVRTLDRQLRQFAQERDRECGNVGAGGYVCSKLQGHSACHTAADGWNWPHRDVRAEAARAEAAHLWTIRTRRDNCYWIGEAFRDAEIRYCSVGEPSEQTALKSALAFVRSLAGMVPVTVVPAPAPAPEPVPFEAIPDPNWDGDPLEAAMALNVTEETRDRLLHELKRREDFYDNVERADGTITDVKAQEDDFVCRLLAVFQRTLPTMAVLLYLFGAALFTGCTFDVVVVDRAPDAGPAGPWRGTPVEVDAGTDGAVTDGCPPPKYDGGLFVHICNGAEGTTRCLCTCGEDDFPGTTRVDVLASETDTLFQDNGASCFSSNVRISCTCNCVTP